MNLTRTSSHKWRCRVYSHGIIKSRTFPLRADAIAWGRQQEITLSQRSCRDSGRETAGLTTSLTLQEAWDQYREHRLPELKDQHTLTQRAQFWINHLGNQLVAEITPQLVRRYLDKLTTANGTKNRYLAALQSVLTYHDVRLSVRHYKESTPKDRVLSLDEEERLLGACRRSERHDLAPIVQVLLSTGMRLGELTSIQPSDINNNTVILRETKNGTSRLVPIPDCFQEIDIPVKVFRRSFTTACRAAGVDNLTIHSLRHTCATRLASKGVSPFLIAKLLGHKSLQTTARYAHLSIDDIRKLVTA